MDYTLPGALRPSAIVITAGFLVPVLLAAVRRRAPDLCLVAGGPALASRQDALTLGADDWAENATEAARVFGARP